AGGSARHRRRARDATPGSVALVSRAAGIPIALPRPGADSTRAALRDDPPGRLGADRDTAVVHGAGIVVVARAAGLLVAHQDAPRGPGGMSWIAGLVRAGVPIEIAQGVDRHVGAGRDLTRWGEADVGGAREPVARAHREVGLVRMLACPAETNVLRAVIGV